MALTLPLKATAMIVNLQHQQVKTLRLYLAGLVANGEILVQTQKVRTQEIYRQVQTNKLNNVN